MRNLIVVVQISLDGFVAGEKGEFDKFLGGEENLGFVCGITESADAALFGRVSYQLLNGDWPTAAGKDGATDNIKQYSNWYNSVPKYVLSKTLKNLPAGNSSLISGNLQEEILSIKAKPGKDILVFGSPTACQYLFQLHLIDQVWIIVHPVIFGTGIPFFRPGAGLERLELKVSQQLSNGTLCNNYKVLSAPAGRN